MTVEELLWLMQASPYETRFVLAERPSDYYARRDELMDYCADHGTRVSLEHRHVNHSVESPLVTPPGEAYRNAYDRASWLLLLGIYPTPKFTAELRESLGKEPRRNRFDQNGDEAAGRRRALREAGYRLGDNHLFYHPNPLRPQPRRPLGEAMKGTT